MLNLLSSSPQILMVAGMAIIIWVLWRRSNRHFGRGGTAHQPVHRLSKLANDRDRALNDAPPEVMRWQVEMQELARDMKGELDTKMAMLQLLIRQAQQAADRLEQAATKADAIGGFDPLDHIESWPHDATAMGDMVATTRHPQATTIYTLADQGHPPAAIARETGLPLGDVEMTLSLRESAAD